MTSTAGRTGSPEGSGQRILPAATQGELKHHHPITPEARRVRVFPQRLDPVGISLTGEGQERA